MIYKKKSANYKHVTLTFGNKYTYQKTLKLKKNYKQPSL
jgi:hypothetical protein